MFGTLTKTSESLQSVDFWVENMPTVWPWLIFSASLLAGIVAGWLVGCVLRRTARHLESRSRPSRARIALDLIGPASLAIFTFGFQIGAIHLEIDTTLRSYVSKTAALLYLVAAFWYAYNLVNVLDLVVRKIGRYSDSALDQQMVLLISRTLRVCVIALGTLTIAKSVFDRDITAWLAGLGIAGLAVSLAAQDSLKNLFGSITLLFDRSFRIGDRVITCGYDGTIEDIGFRSTKIRTTIGHLVTIPNSSLANCVIENVSRRPAVRNVVTLTLPGNTPCEKVRGVLMALRGIFEDAALGNPIRETGHLPEVRLEEIQVESLKVTVTYWYAPAADPSASLIAKDYATYVEQINLRILDELQRAGISPPIES
jgi:MscS family membrane protein